MKKIFITIIFLLTITVTQSQTSGIRGFGSHSNKSHQTLKHTYKIKGNATETTLWINKLSADLEIVGSTGPDIEITVYGYEGLPERAKGLKPLGASGPENTGVGLSLNQDGSRISLSAAHNKANDARYVLTIPKKLKLKADYGTWRGGDLSIKNMENEIEARVQVSDLKIENVNGPIVAHSLSSDIEVIFKSLDQAFPSSISSTSGDIDITLPTSIKGTFNMSSVSGGVYTDMNFDITKDESANRITGSSATGKLNGGGVEVRIRSVSGDIYVRKSK